jgi:parvulin-like peptidyl-prolyl isomerase
VSELTRRGWLLGCVLILAALLTACGGGESEPSEQVEAASNTAPLAQEPAGAEQAAAQVAETPAPTEEPRAARFTGDPTPRAAFERERERRMLGIAVEPATAAAFDASVLEAMIDQALIVQAARELGISVTDEAIDAELQIQSDLAAANGQTLEEIVTAQLYTMDEYRQVIHDMLLAQQVSESVAQVTPFAEQVHSRHILVTDEATARSLLEQIEQGADFAQLAHDYSLDASTARTGGDLDWVSEGDLLQPEVEAAIFALAPGEMAPEPVRSSLGYHVVQTLERVQDRPLTGVALAEKRQRAFVAWLEQQRAAATIERFVGG